MKKRILLSLSAQSVFMVSWATRQQFKYGGIVAVFLVVLLIILYFFFFDAPETCYDDVKNQDEVRVDCGGACSSLCTLGDEVIVLWSRVLERTSGEIDVVARIQNPNPDAGTEELSYTFELYDDENLLIVERSGKTFVNKQEEFVVIERGIAVGEREPTRVFVNTTRQTPWKLIEGSPAQLSVSEKQFIPREESGDSRPRLTATLTNNGFSRVEDIILSALIYDVNGNIASVASTLVEGLEGESSASISFIFPHEVPETPGRIEVLYRVFNTGS